MLRANVRQCKMSHLVHENPVIEELALADVAADGDADERARAPNVVPLRTPPPLADETRMRSSETGKRP